MLTVALAAVLIWGGFFFFASRQIRRRVRQGTESTLHFEMQSAPWSDRHIETLLSRNPSSAVLLRQYVTNALDRHEWQEALRRADMFTSRLPRLPGAWLSRIDALRCAGRAEDSVALLERTVLRLPPDPDVLLVWAREAALRRDWDEAARRHARFRRRYPARVEGYREAADALAEHGRTGEAEQLIAEGLRRMPEASALWHGHARIAERAGDMEEALRRWEAVRVHFPGEPAGFLRSAEAMVKAGHAADAETLIRQARDFFPESQPVRDALKRLVPAADPPPS